MTGFARADASHEGWSISWELKSVNGKSLDIRLRLPQGLERVEPPARQAIQRRFARASLNGMLTVSRSESQPSLQVNEAMLRMLAGIAMRLHVETGCAPPRADGLLGLRGVLENPVPGEETGLNEALEAEILACLELALDRLEQARLDEGKALGGFLAEQIDRIESLTLRAEADPSRTPSAMQERLRQQVHALLEGAGGQLDEQRLYHEAALLATKVDIREEIDRLRAHVAAARTLLQEPAAIGRRLDFLAQEFNREANTLCSKAHSSSLTATGLEMKAVVDQFREQVQNLE